MKQLGMKTSLIAMGLAAAVSPNANAGELRFDFRADAQNTSYNDAVGKPNTTSFRLSRMRLDARGKMGELTSYRTRFRFDKANTAMFARDNTSKFIDYAYISRKVADGAKLHFGKLATNTGGVEGYQSSADVQLYTIANEEADPIFYVTGVQATYDWEGQTFALTVGNPSIDFLVDKDNDGDGDYMNQDRNLYGVTYHGSFLEGSLLPIVTYFEDDHGLQGGLKQKNTYMAVGAQYKIADFEFEADALMNKYNNKTVDGQNDSTDSYYALARYKWNGINPYVKYETSTKKAFTAGPTETKTDYKGLTLAVEYYPVKEENFRYHAYYTERTEKADTANAVEKKTSILYVGVRMVADILK